MIKAETLVGWLDREGHSTAATRVVSLLKQASVEERREEAEGLTDEADRAVKLLPEAGGNLNLPEEIYEGTGHDLEDAILIKNIPVECLTMLQSQGDHILADIYRGELSHTEGLPVLYYNTDKNQLIVDDGNHRIFQLFLNGADHIDAMVYSSGWHPTLRSVYDGEEAFDWSFAKVVRSRRNP